MTLAIFAVATASIFIRKAQEVGVPSPSIAAGRLGIATLVLLPLALRGLLRELPRLRRREWGLGVLSGLLLALHFATWIRSLEMTSVASSVVLVCTTPLWVALASPVLLGEAVARRVVVGMLLAVVGGTIVGTADAGGGESPGASALAGNLLALLGAVAAAGYFMVGRRLRARLSLLSYVTVVYGTAAVALVLHAAAAGHGVGEVSAEGGMWCVLLALIPQLIGHSTFNWGLRFLSAATVSLLVLGEPVGAILLAWLILGEIPGPVKLLGCAVILCGIALASRVPRARDAASEPTGR